MDPEASFALVRSIGEECINEDELRALIVAKPNFRLYDGFEPSGRMHIAQGVFKAVNVNKCTQAGGRFIFWVADWFALMNDKMGGDLKKIKMVGEYLIEVWKAAGMDMEKVQFVWASEEINKHAKDYWMQALDIARRFTIARITKCCQIMGRKENTLSAAQILYPIMQCTDIFFLKTDVCQLGVDQRKVNMLAREYCDLSGRKHKPVILSHHMLYGLKKGQQKMSKSDPDSAIFMEDSTEDVRRKIMQAHCPANSKRETVVVPPASITAASCAHQQQEDESEENGMHLEVDDLMNPCLDYIKYIIFSKPGSVFKIGESIYSNFVDVNEAFVGGRITETELKEALTVALDLLLEPVRNHFKHDGKARTLLETIREFKKDAPPVPEPAPRTDEVMRTPATVVFSELPTFRWSLITIFATLQQLQAIPEGHEAILYIRDWTAFVANACGAEEAAIKAAYVVLCEALSALDPKTMERTKMLWQSKAILDNPNDYWIDVINVGRKFMLSEIRVLKSENGAEQLASDVLVALMHVADVLHTRPTVIRSTPDHQKLHALANDYLQSIGSLAADVVLTAPTLPLLKQNGEWADPDCHISILDTEKEVNGKMKKKAFCEPGNVSFCPPLTIAKEILLPMLGGRIEIQRKDSDGGSKVLTSFDELTDDVAAGRIHPNDLKPNVARMLNEVLAGVRDRFKTSAVAKKAAEDLAKLEKKVASKKE